MVGTFFFTMSETLDILLNIIVPLLCLLGSGFYVFSNGKFWVGVLIAWGLLFAFEILSLVAGILMHAYAPSHGDMFEEGPGIFVMLIVGWIPGIVVCGIAMLIRYFASRIKVKRE